MKYKKDYIVICIYFLLTVFSLRDILFRYGVIGYRHDWNVPQYGFLVKHYYDYINEWVPIKLGQYSPFSSFSYFIYFSFFILSLLGFGGVFITKFIVFFSIFLSSFFMYVYLRSKDLKYSFLGGVIYGFSPVLFNKIIAGHIFYLICYSIAPLFFYTFSKKSKLYLLLSILIFSVFYIQIQFVFMITFILFVYSIFNRKMKKFLLVVVFGSLLQIDIIPSHFGEDYIDMIFRTTSEDSIRRSSPSPLAIPFMLGYIYLVNSFKNIPILFFVWVINLIILFLMVFRKIKFSPFLLTLIVGLFFVKGYNPPLGELFNLLGPIKYVFREVYHLMFIVAFSYALVLVESLDKVRLPIYYTFVFILIYCLPFLSGNFLGNIQLYTWPDEYHEIMKFFDKDMGIYRVLYIPYLQPIKYDSLQYSGLDPMIFFSPKPSLDSEFFSFGDNNLITSFLFNNLNESFSKQLLGILNVKYIVKRDDFFSEFYKINFLKFNFTETLSQSYKPSSLTVQYSNLRNKTTIFTNDEFLPKFYASNDPLLVSGDLSIYKLISRDDLIFAKQNKIDYVINIKNIVIQNNNYIDLFYLFLNKSNIIFFNVNNVDARKGWSLLFNYAGGWWWYNPNYSVGISNSLISLNKSVISKKMNLTGDYIFFVKLFYGSRGGNITFKINNYTFNLNTKRSNMNYFKWFSTNILHLNGSTNISLINNDGENIVSDVFLLSVSEYNQIKNKLNTFLKNKKIYHCNLSYCDVPKKNAEKLYFKKLDRNTYFVFVNDTKYVFFSESYSPFWRTSSSVHIIGNVYQNVFLMNNSSKVYYYNSYSYLNRMLNLIVLFFILFVFCFECMKKINCKDFAKKLKSFILYIKIHSFRISITSLLLSIPVIKLYFIFNFKFFLYLGEFLNIFSFFIIIYLLAKKYREVFK